LTFKPSATNAIEVLSCRSVFQFLLKEYGLKISKKQDSVPVNKNFITTIVEVPEVHVPKLEVTVVHFWREADEDGECLLAIDHRLRNFDESDETVSDRAGLAVSDL
jgi:hypothetical protein